uniref:Uncharacterized protein n=1 Tax=Salix viminalis TaxID=40686 RepID=A0A6N2KXT5_SALVM
MESGLGDICTVSQGNDANYGMVQAMSGDKGAPKYQDTLSFHLSAQKVIFVVVVIVFVITFENWMNIRTLKEDKEELQHNARKKTLG